MRLRLAFFSFAVVLCAFALAQTTPVAFVNQPLRPTSVNPGHAAFTLNVSGTGFKSGAVVNWNGSARTTTFVSASKLQAAITATDVAKPGTAAINVVNPGAQASNTAYFLVHAPSAAVAFARRDLPVTSAYFPGGYALGDFNHDGKLDIAVGGYQNPDYTLEVFLGKGDGTFQSPVTTISTYQPASLLAADLNGDGRLDLLLQDPSGSTMVFLGNGDGTFAGQSFFGSVDYASSLAADLNRDGKLDFLTVGGGFSQGGYYEAAFLGNGDGTFVSSQGFQLSIQSGIPALGDFNHDGKLDLAVGGFEGPSYAVDVFLGNGDGSFQNPVSYTTTFPVNAVAAADINGDGNLDLVTDGVSVLLGKGDGTFTETADYSVAVNPVSIQLADINNDGRLDAVLVQSSNNYPPIESYSIMLGNGDGTFQNPVSWNSDTYIFPGGPGVGDFNGDGKLDLVDLNTNALTAWSTVTVLLQTTLEVSPTLMNFGAVNVGSSSTQTLTLTNVGARTLPLGPIHLVGPASGYSVNSGCGKSLASGASCPVEVTFTPASKKTLTAIVGVAYQDTGTPQYIELTGSGN